MTLKSLLLLSLLIPFGAIAQELPPRESETIRFNPVIDGVRPTVKSSDSTVTIEWTGGGHLERLRETLLKRWDYISNVSPHQEPAEGHGIFRIMDPWDGGRGVSVSIPASYDPETPIPVVILLHGRTSTPFYIESFLFKLKPLSESHRFIYARPIGLRDEDGDYF